MGYLEILKFLGYNNA